MSDATKVAHESARKFDFGKSSAGMADLMRRLYGVRFECGVVEDEETAKKKQEEQKRAQKKLDKFELTKLDIVNMIKEAREMLVEREKYPNDLHIKNAIKKLLPKIDAKLRDLKKFQKQVKSKIGPWQTNTMDPDVLEQRDEDVRLIEQHIQALQQRQRKLVMGGNGGQGKGGSSKFNERRPKFDTIDSLQDTSTMDELPEIDISEGLKQIEENKKKQDEMLDVIGGQLDNMRGIAAEMGDELDVQLKLLEKMDQDVSKYNANLGKLNTTLDKALKQVGGPTRLLLIAIVGLIILGLIGGLFLFLSNYLKS